MPIEGLRNFTRLNNRRYRYNGLVIPYKISNFNPYKKTSTYLYRKKCC